MEGDVTEKQGEGEPRAQRHPCVRCIHFSPLHRNGRGYERSLAEWRKVPLRSSSVLSGSWRNPGGRGLHRIANGAHPWKTNPDLPRKPWDRSTDNNDAINTVVIYIIVYVMFGFSASLLD